jgi:thiosulfate dehydrogenase [quinone] large subunit
MKNDLTNNDVYSGSQLFGLVILRILIGWHFLYEGISKLVNPYWSSAAYLLDSKWIFSSLAERIVANPTLLEFTDSVNMCGLTIVGLSLLLGFMSRYGAIAGLVFILLYYIFAPPFIGLEYSKPGEGSYIIVNKNLIEACALYVLFLFPTSQLIGLDRLISSIQSK